MRLRGKVAIVTGSGSGIGLATAELFACEGARLVIADVDPQLGKCVEVGILERGGDALFVLTDVAREEDVKRMAAATASRYGKVDILVNSAGIAVAGNALQISEEVWEHCMAVNLKGVWLCSKHVIPLMGTEGGGIINIASTHPFRAQSNYFPYAVAKGGLLALSSSLAVDFGPRHIRVNSVCPGFIDTPMNHELLSKLKESPERYEEFLAAHPLRCLGEAEDVAHACVFLASDESRFVTGATLIVDGGRTVYGHFFGDMIPS
ncbi:MAG: SDR family oxidoreductase [Acidobacteriia bacterium]|nr:SDR family oxidoreductase [Terriglobia bacterium]